MRRYIGLALVLLIALAACSDTSDTSSNSADKPWEYKLAVIHGDASTEAQFKQILDRLQAGGGICKPEPDRQRVSDTLVAGWEASGKNDSLLEYSRAVADACA